MVYFRSRFSGLLNLHITRRYFFTARAIICSVLQIKASAPQTAVTKFQGNSFNFASVRVSGSSCAVAAEQGLSLNKIVYVYFSVLALTTLY